MTFKNIIKGSLKNTLLLKSSIKYRLLFSFLFLVFLPTSIISVTIYYKSKNIITEMVYNSTTNNLNMIETSFRQKLDDINNVMLLIYFSPELQTIFSSPYFGPQSQTVLSPEYPSKEINMVNEMASLDRLLNNYSVLNMTNVPIFPNFYIYNRPEYLLYNSSDKVTDLSKIENEPWYSKMPSECEYFVVGYNKVVKNTTQISTLKIAKRLYGLKNIQIPYAGLLTVDAGIEGFDSILKTYKPSAGSTIFIIDENNKIISSSDDSLVGSDMSTDICDAKSILKYEKDPAPFLKQTSKESNMIISCKRMSNPNFIIVSKSPASEIYGDLDSFNMVMMVVLVVCLLLSFIVAILLSENISSPIRKLVKSMSTVQVENPDINIDYKRNDEFSYLIKTYRTMLNNIKDLIDKLYKSEVNKKEAELKALQAQINPHFLYNTLDSVNWLAMKHNVSDISTMVTSLSDFFRYSLSKGNSIIPLGDERKQVESYLAIQKVRFKEKLDYSINFPPELNDYLTVKLILQPLVENAIIHGIEIRKGKGTITISAEKSDNVIEIKVSDDGVGGNVEEMNRMLEHDDTLKSFGSRNVNKRINQVFGAEFGIRFYDNEPTGVTAVVRIPALKTLEVLND